MVARILVAAGELDPDASHDAMAFTNQLTAREELWPFVLWARATYALLWGDQQSMLDELEAERAQQDPRRQSHLAEGVASSLLAAAEANVLIALGRGNQARAILNGARHDHPALTAARARLALLAGENERALELTRACVLGPSAELRQAAPGDRARAGEVPELDTPSDYAHFRQGAPLHRLDMTITAAIASFRLGDIHAATDTLRRAVRRADSLGTLLPFAFAPRAELEALAKLCPQADALLGREPLASAPDVFPPAVAVITLTEREQLVLDQLARRAQAREIAAVLFVSVNTVKTQLQSLYRKLGVSSRGQAIAVASELKLIASHEPPLIERQSFQAPA